MIRRASTEDPVARDLLAELSDLYVEAYGASDVDVTDLDVVMVAESESGPVGVAGWKDVGHGRAHLRRLFVRQPGRGQGWGQRLVDAVIADAVAAGHDVLVFDTDATNRWVLTRAHARGARRIPGTLRRGGELFRLDVSGKEPFDALPAGQP